MKHLLHLFISQVHTLATYENTLVSGGEDLSIRVWNLDSHTEENCVLVSKNFFTIYDVSLKLNE